MITDLEKVQAYRAYQFRSLFRVHLGSGSFLSLAALSLHFTGPSLPCKHAAGVAFIWYILNWCNMSWSDPVTNTSKHCNTLKLFNRNLWFRLDVAKFGWWWLMEIDGWMAMPSLSATPGPSSKPLTRPTCCGLIAAIVTRHAARTALSAGKHPFYGHRYALQHVYCRSFGDCWCMYFAKGLSNSFRRSMPNYVGRASTNRGSSLGPWWWLQSPRWGTQRPPNRSSCNSPMRNVNPGLINQGLITPLLLHWRGPIQTHFSRYSLQKKTNSCFLIRGWN